MFTPKQFLKTSPLLLAFATAALPASGKFDLERTTPVPANEPIPVEDFFREPILQQPSLNPSGTHIAAIVTAGEDQSALMVYDLQTKEIESVGAREDSDVDWVRWLNDDRLAYRISVRKLFGFIMCCAKVGALRGAYPIFQNINATLIAVPPGDRLHPLVSIEPHSEVTGRYGQVMTFNAALDSGKLIDLNGTNGQNMGLAAENNVRHIAKRMPVLETPDGFQLNYLADKEGQLEYGVTSTNGVLALFRLDGDQWERCPENLDEINVIGCGDNPGEIVVLGPRKDNQPRPLEVLEAATGRLLNVLVQDKAYDASAWLYRDPVTHNIVGAVYDRAGPFVVWFDDTYRNLQKQVDGLFPGQVVRIIGNDEKGKMVLISSFSDRQSPVYSWVNREKRDAGLIKDSRPWLDAKRMLPMSVIKFRTRDGRSLDAYVTMPAGASKTNPPPLVVLPHASLWWRDTWGFNTEVQFLASRGYAVLQPNYRGSSGSTWMFPTDDEWAYRKMSDDVTDATKALVGSGLVDPKRVAIMGTDFGGFLALSGAAYEPGLYRCAVAISAVADWGKSIADFKYNKFNSSYYSRMVYKLGDPSQNPEKWDAIAPLRHADQIRSALFIANGEYDASIDINGTKEIASIVEKNHFPVETVTFTNEANGVRHLGHKVELYSHIADFLAKNLGPAN